MRVFTDVVTQFVICTLFDWVFSVAIFDWYIAFIDAVILHSIDQFHTLLIGDLHIPLSIICIAVDTFLTISQHYYDEDIPTKVPSLDVLGISTTR